MMRESVGENDRLRRVSAAFVSGVGVVTGGIHGYHLITHVPDAFPAIIYGIGLPLCLSLALIGAGGWLTQSDIPAEHTTRVVAWSIAGAVVFTVSGVLMIRYQQAEGVMMSDRMFVLIDGTTGGMTIGFVFGLYATQIKRQTAQLDRYQRRLERERDRFVALFDNLPNPVVQYEYAGDTPVVRVVNPAFERTFDADGTTVTGTPVDEIIVPSDQKCAHIDLDAVLHAEEMMQDEIRLKTATGIREFLLLVIPPRIATTERTGHIIAIDVTESNQYVRRLEVLNRVLRHDLRNHTGVIIGNSDLLIEELSETKRVETIRETADKLVELGDTVQQIEHALDRNRETKGTIALLDVLEECIDRAQDEYPDADIKTEIPANETIVVSANKQIDSVFDNVIENAIEHNDAAVPVVSITVTTDTDSFVTIEIADNGPGIPDREQQVLKEKTETQLKHSLGLGLWFINWLVVDSGGEVTFDDNDSHGSVVTIDLPKADHDEREMVNERSTSSMLYAND